MSSPHHTAKDELLAELAQDRDWWLRLLDRIEGGRLERAAVSDVWRERDILGHLSFWEHQTLDHIRQTLTEGLPHPMSASDTETDINGREVTKRKDWTLQRIRAEFENIRNALIQRVGELSESALGFYVPSPWVNDARFLTLEQMIREDVLQHSQEHRMQVEP